MDTPQEMLTTFNGDPDLLKMIGTSNELWAYGYDIETKAQSSQWKRIEEPRTKNASQYRSYVKVLHTVFFDCNGVVHHKYLLKARTVNKEYFIEIMRRLG